MKAAIVGLVRGYRKIERYSKLIRRNRLLHRNFNKWFDYPVILFHEGNVLPEHQRVMCRITPHLSFVDVSDKAFVAPPDLPPKWQTQIGYKHMCRFYGVQLYDFVAEYDYIMRLDDDSFLESPIRYDLFEFMQTQELDYGYIHAEFDYHEQTVETLPSFTRQYIKQRNIDVNCSTDDINALYYYSNFLITKVSFWQQPKVQEFLQAIDNSMGIYQYRWGDHVIQTHALKMFSMPNRIYRFSDFLYFHGSHEWSNYKQQRLYLLVNQRLKKYRRWIERRYLNFLLTRS